MAMRVKKLHLPTAGLRTFQPVYCHISIVIFFPSAVAITNWWVSLLAPVSRSICKQKQKQKQKINEILGFDDSSSGGRLNRL